jgi:Flp pilus assembly protein TadB
MLDMFINSMKLFFKGKLFRDPKAVVRQWAIGLAATLAVFVVLAILGLPLTIAVGIAAIAGGALQPFLFKDLKYA